MKPFFNIEAIRALSDSDRLELIQALTFNVMSGEIYGSISHRILINVINVISLRNGDIEITTTRRLRQGNLHKSRALPSYATNIAMQRMSKLKTYPNYAAYVEDNIAYTTYILPEHAFSLIRRIVL